jgi:hypothetical protein
MCCRSFPGLLGTHGIGGMVAGSCGGDLLQLGAADVVSEN